MEKIDFQIMSSANTVVNHQMQGYIILEENHLEYRANYFCDITDDVKGLMKDVCRDYRECLTKAHIAGVYVSFYDNDEKSNWKVNVSANGVSEDVYVFFENEAPARELFERIYKWLYLIEAQKDK